MVATPKSLMFAPFSTIKPCETPMVDAEISMFPPCFVVKLSFSMVKPPFSMVKPAFFRPTTRHAAVLIAVPGPKPDPLAVLATDAEMAAWAGGVEKQDIETQCVV